MKEIRAWDGKGMFQLHKPKLLPQFAYNIHQHAICPTVYLTSRNIISAFGTVDIRSSSWDGYSAVLIRMFSWYTRRSRVRSSPGALFVPLSCFFWFLVSRVLFWFLVSRVSFDFWFHVFLDFWFHHRKLSGLLSFLFCICFTTVDCVIF